jgi:hypothetical protein
VLRLIRITRLAYLISDAKGIPMMKLTTPGRFQRNRPNCGMIRLLVGVALLPACNTLPFTPDTAQAPESLRFASEARAEAPNCLLPGQVRNLASQLVYIAPRQAVKIGAEDCEERGGEVLSRKF